MKPPAVCMKCGEPMPEGVELGPCFEDGKPCFEASPARKPVLWDDGIDGSPGQDYNSAFQDLLDPW